MSSALNFLLGVASGLAAAFVLWVLGKVVPAILMRVQNEIILASDWSTKFKEDGKDYEETVSLTQAGRRVTGTITLKLSTKEVSTYKFEGTFRHRVLTATYHTTNPSEYEQGAFALKYVKDRLVGQYILFSRKNDESEDFVASRYEWVQLD